MRKIRVTIATVICCLNCGTWNAQNSRNDTQMNAKLT